MTHDNEEPSAASAGSVDEPVAWAVLGKGEIAGHVIGLHDTAMEAHARVGRMVGWGEISTADKVQVVPLYRQPQPTLTDAERDALEVACQDLRHTEEVATLRGLLERLE